MNQLAEELGEDSGVNDCLSGGIISRRSFSAIGQSGGSLTVLPEDDVAEAT
jgi:hypothetical protein